MRLLSAFYQTISSVVISLTLALLIWVTATNIELELITYPESAASPGLPIQLINQSEGLVVLEQDKESVRVDLRIAKDLKNRLEASDLIVEADLAGLEPGTHQVAVNVRPQPLAPTLQLIGPKPDRILVTLDEVMSRTLPIDVEITDRTAIPQTYQVLTTTVQPPEMTIIGPKTIIESKEKVRAQIRLNDAREPVTRQIRPQLVGLTQDEAAHVSFSVEEVAVTVDIQLRPGYRDLIVGTDIQGEPAPGYWVSDVSVSPQLVTVVGLPTIISELDGVIDTEPINVEGLSEGELIREAQLRLPEGVSPLNTNFVEVRIKIEPQTSSKRVNVEPVITGLQPSLIVPEGAIVPPTVNILLKGSIAELEALQLDQIAVTLDVTELGAGSHLIEPAIKAPGSLNAESVNPELVEVTIEQQQATREFEVPIRLIDVPPNTVVAMSPNQTLVGLQAAVSVIEKLKATDVQPVINLTGFSEGTYQITPSLFLSDSVTLVSELPKVALTLYDEEELIAVSDLVTVTNLAEGLRATLNQPVIRIRVAGEGEANDTLPSDAQTLRESEEFAIEVNVENLDVGTHPIRPTIRLPEGYTLVDITPPQVELTLQSE